MGQQQANEQKLSIVQSGYVLIYRGMFQTQIARCLCIDADFASMLIKHKSIACVPAPSQPGPRFYPHVYFLSLVSLS